MNRCSRQFFYLLWRSLLFIVEYRQSVAALTPSSRTPIPPHEGRDAHGLYPHRSGHVETVYRIVLVTSLHVRYSPFFTGIGTGKFCCAPLPLVGFLLHNGRYPFFQDALAARVPLVSCHLRECLQTPSRGEANRSDFLFGEMMEKERHSQES